MCPSHHFDHQLSAVYWRAVIFIISCVFSNCWTQISDFGTTGLASHLSGTNSVHADVAGQTLFTTSAIGTVCWTAPEILRNEPYGLEVDVFSFGIVMYEIATRELPFVELPSVHHVRQAIIKGERPALKSSCPVMFGKLMHECWADDRKARPKFYEIRARLLHGVDESAV
eukprot:m.215568 g.215568  ORF g.215568 m.215568 type:complete len:170 (-) comp16978_c0_seq3:100-609(-)